ncbi:hypothetical protein [Filimonas effusa]|uniref:RHS repeat protein n=1 Tax=Filimonas effusa TaxID=2508721 RepID=A0A4Q1D3Q0_9BACT|nr:hypothetical protein [Filimonas effusa]RXK83009.1 hypothetical protein ESB13_12860 [Filimonas effusa]
MKQLQPLLLLLAVFFTQCKSSVPAKKLQEPIKVDQASIVASHVHVSRYYDVRYDANGEIYKKRLVKTSYYDSAGKAVLVIRPVYNIDASLPPGEISDSATGRFDSTFYTYDEAGRIIKTVSHYHYNIDPREGTVIYVYDSLGNQVMKTDITEGIDTNVQRTNYVYEEHGRIKYSDNIMIGRMYELSRDQSKRTEYAYDNRGNIVKMGDQAFLYNKDGKLVQSESSYKGVVVGKSFYKYDDAGNCVGITGLYLNEESNKWDTAGNGVYTYDKRNLLVKGFEKDFDRSSVSRGFLYEYE